MTGVLFFGEMNYEEAGFLAEKRISHRKGREGKTLIFRGFCGLLQERGKKGMFYRSAAVQNNTGLSQSLVLE